MPIPEKTAIMATKNDAPANVFFTCAVHLQHIPPWLMKWDPPAVHGLDEAITKMDRFCHQIHHVPITWLCSYAALQKYGDRLARFIRDYGDEVAIMEGGIATRESLNGQEAEYQGWVEECGLRRPDDDYQSKEPGVSSARAFHDMSADEQTIALTYLKQTYDRVLGQNTRILACPHQNQNTIRIMGDLGLEVSWAYNWDYFCEGINNKGCLFYPFYVSQLNHNIPEQEAGRNRVLAVHWGPISPVIMNHVGTHCRNGLPGYCLNALEMTQRGEGLDKFNFHRKVIEEWAGWGKWNPFVHIPLQLEAVWMDEGPSPAGVYDMYPAFNPANTEVFYTQIETALRVGARPMTISGFADWHRTKIGDTAEMIWHSADPLPDLRGKGKDQAYQPLVLYGDKHRQYWFDKSRGFNYVRKYTYNPVVKEADIEDEYPFATEPRVYLRVKHQDNLRAGIAIRQGKASYELAEFDLTAYHDDPDYAAILWEANLPFYVTDADLETGGAVTGFRTVREKNLAILFANLKKGTNQTVFRSELPGRFIRVVSSERVGRRYEIWIQNDGDPVGLHTFEADLPPGLAFGGFWWDGQRHPSLFRYGWFHYDLESGRMTLKIMYPITLPIHSGLTRFSLELR